MNNEEFHYSDERDDRRKETGEVFTPDIIVQEMLDNFSIDWDNPPQDKIFLDPTCGSGNFLIALARRGIPLLNIYGVDLMPDNVEMTKKRLREYFQDKMTPEDIEFHLNRNIIEADALTYHYEFWWHDPVEYKKRQQEQLKLLEFKAAQEAQKLKLLDVSEIQDDEW